jgi:hypothetical protein
MGLEAGEGEREPRRDGISSAPGKLDPKTVRLGAAGLIVVAAIVVGAIALLGGGSNDSSPAGADSATPAVALSESELLARASDLGQTAIWVGPTAGTKSYELSTEADGRVYIRYLTGDAKAGDPRPDFLTVGTYPVAGAGAALRNAAKAAPGQTLSHHAGYEVLSSKEATNAYVVFDDQPDLQIEIFSPQPGEAADLASSGALKPLG